MIWARLAASSISPSPAWASASMPARLAGVRLLHANRAQGFVERSFENLPGSGALARRGQYKTEEKMASLMHSRPRISEKQGELRVGEVAGLFSPYSVNRGTSPDMRCGLTVSAWTSASRRRGARVPRAPGAWSRRNGQDAQQS